MTDHPKPRRATYTLHVISHVRWRRERLLPQQAIRLRLVSLLDSLLDLFDADPRYRYFMLDGQTILIEDYLSVRPERFEQIERMVRDGQLLIGPWYVQPDFFLTSPEAHLRNLLVGTATARVFGATMPIGYVPEATGQIAQMPQILRGFSLDTAAIVRGLDDEPVELFWESPDGSRVLLIYLRDGYDALRRVPVHTSEVVEAIRRERESLAPFTVTGHLPILNGADSAAALPHLPDAIMAATAALPDTVFHSSLPAYLQLMRPEARELPIVRGELRSPARHPIGQGTLSARPWIKQRNHAAEVLLTRWLEPFAAWAEVHGAEMNATQGSDVGLLPLRLKQPQTAVGRAWRLLLENHAQDSIGGTVSDTVCADILSRFEQVTQIGEEITRGALQSLADSADTSALNGDGAALIVFNPSPEARTDLVDVTINLPGHFESGFEIVDEQGQPIYFTTSAPVLAPDVAHLTLNRDGLQGARTVIANGRLLGHAIQDVFAQRADDTLAVILTVTDGEPALRAIEVLIKLADQAAADQQIATIELRFRRTMAYHVRFVARTVPPLGYAVYGIALPEKVQPAPEVRTPVRELSIENSFLRATLNPEGTTITLLDKVRGQSYVGLLTLESEGDQGDAYNFCPIGRAIQINHRLDSDGLLQVREAYADRLYYAVNLMIDPAPEMEPLTGQNTTLRVDVELILLRDVPRLDVRLTVHNTLANHRLRVHFPLPFTAQTADYDDHFEIIQRPVQDWPAISPPEGWAETQLSTVPQRAFVAVFAPQPPDGPLWGDESDALTRPGLLIANRGLPEADVLMSENGNTEIAITLLRSTSWLSRSDVLTRARDVGPAIKAAGLEMIGSHSAELSIIPADSGRANFADGWAFSEGPLRATVTTLHEGSLPASTSLIRSSDANFRISTVKLPEDTARGGFIVRGYNTTGESHSVTLTPWRRFAVVDVVQMDESETGGRLAVESDGTIEFKAAPHRILTFWVHD